MNERICSRRQLLGGAGLAGVGVVALGACATTEVTVPVPVGKVIAQTSEIPLGGGKVFDKWAIVVTQPIAGSFRAFTAVCTHQGCTVGKPVHNVITCPCHGSQYNATDGSVEMGPAELPLKEYKVKLQGTGIIVATS
jgi:Rieske Fe-S protein